MTVRPYELEIVIHVAGSANIQVYDWLELVIDAYEWLDVVTHEYRWLELVIPASDGLES